MTDLTNYYGRTTKELRALLRGAGLPTSGIKQNLIDRLEEFDEQLEREAAHERELEAEVSVEDHILLDELLSQAQEEQADVPNPTLLMAQVPEEPKQPVAVIVIGSYDWTVRSVVQDVLVNWWVDAGQPPVQLITSGCPVGAEAIARDVAVSHEWTPLVVRDEEMTKLDAIVFGFVKDDSIGATDALAALIPTHWVRTFHDQTSRIVSKWGSR